MDEPAPRDDPLGHRVQTPGPEIGSGEQQSSPKAPPRTHTTARLLETVQAWPRPQATGVTRQVGDRQFFPVAFTAWALMSKTLDVQVHRSSVPRRYLILPAVSCASGWISRIWPSDETVSRRYYESSVPANESESVRCVFRLKASIPAIAPATGRLWTIPLPQGRMKRPPQTKLSSRGGAVGAGIVEAAYGRAHRPATPRGQGPVEV